MSQFNKHRNQGCFGNSFSLNFSRTSVCRIKKVDAWNVSKSILSIEQQESIQKVQIYARYETSDKPLRDTFGEKLNNNEQLPLTKTANFAIY